MQPLKGVPISPITGIPGWETEAEEKHLIFYAGLVPDRGAIVEIGAEYGRSAGAFLTATKSHPEIKVYSIDLFPRDHHLVGDLRDTYTNNLKEAGFDLDRVRIALGDSSQISLAWSPDLPIDLLFIDGDHTYEGVVRDIKSWTPFVPIGGLVLFHDVSDGEASHPLHKEVLKAVEEYMTPDLFTFETQVHSLRIYTRKDYA